MLILAVLENQNLNRLVESSKYGFPFPSRDQTSNCHNRSVCHKKKRTVSQFGLSLSHSTSPPDVIGTNKSYSKISFS